MTNTNPGHQLEEATPGILGVGVPLHSDVGPPAEQVGELNPHKHQEQQIHRDQQRCRLDEAEPFDLGQAPKRFLQNALLV